MQIFATMRADKQAMENEYVSYTTYRMYKTFEIIIPLIKHKLQLIQRKEVVHKEHSMFFSKCIDHSSCIHSFVRFEENKVRLIGTDVSPDVW